MIFDMVLEEMKSRQAYKYETYVPFYTISYAVHNFNLMNNKRKIYYEGKKILNSRLPILFVSPAGFMKSYYLTNMAGDSDVGVFNNSGVKVGYEQSMCLPAGQKVNMFDGSHKNIEDVNIGDRVLGFNSDSLTLVGTEVTDCHNMPPKQVLRVVLVDGRRLELSHDHPLFTTNGWVHASDISIGEHVAVTRKIKNVRESPEQEKHFAKVLGYMLGDGNFKNLDFYCAYDKILLDFQKSLNIIGFDIKRHSHKGSTCGTYHISGEGTGHIHPIRKMFAEVGIVDCIRDKKFIPDVCFTWGDESVSYLLSGLFNSDGYMSSKQVCFVNLSENLVRGVQELLTRFGILSAVSYNKVTKIWRVYISSFEMIEKFKTSINCVYDFEHAVRDHNGCWLDGIPSDIVSTYDYLKLEKKNSVNLHQNISRGSSTKRSVLKKCGINYSEDIAWVKVKSIDVVGILPVYNISTKEHTFVAETIITHNTEAGLVGTIGKDGFGEPRFVPGAAAVYNEGMMLIDEFSGITQAMKSSGNNQMDSQLLTILDGGHVVKRLASGMHEYDTRLTLWTGVQPAKIDMSSGLGRRFCYMLFMPTRHDNKMIMKARHDAKNIKPDPSEMLKIQNMNKSFVASMNTIERIEYPNEILKLYDDMGIFSFEAQLYDQLILGYNLAKFGAKKRMELVINDELRTLLTREKEWRLEINLGVDLGLMKNMIRILGGTTNTQMLASECTMVGWNAEQMNQVLNDMVRYNMIERAGNKVRLVK